jgi:hypothetical protein
LNYQVEGLVQANWVEVRVLFGACREGPALRGFFVSEAGRLGEANFAWQRLWQTGRFFAPNLPSEPRSVVMGVHYDASRRKHVVRCDRAPRGAVHDGGLNKRICAIVGVPAG